jgi:hypothetical protein
VGFNATWGKQHLRIGFRRCKRRATGLSLIFLFLQLLVLATQNLWAASFACPARTAGRAAPRRLVPPVFEVRDTARQVLTRTSEAKGQAPGPRAGAPLMDRADADR